MSLLSTDNCACCSQSLDVLSDEDYSFDSGYNVLDSGKKEEKEIELQLRRLLIRCQKIPLLLAPEVGGTVGRRSTMLPLLLAQSTVFFSGHKERCRIREGDPYVHLHLHKYPKVGRKILQSCLCRALSRGWKPAVFSGGEADVVQEL